MAADGSTSDDEWRDVLGRFVILRNQRLHAAELDELARDCMTLGERLRDLAFSLAIGIDRGPAEPIGASRDIARLCNGVARAEQRMGVLRPLLPSAADASLGIDRRIDHLLEVGGASLATFRTNELFSVAVVFGRLAELVRSSSQMMSHTAREARTSTRGGRLPQPEISMILAWADEHAVGVRELARRLVESKIAPHASDSTRDDDRPAEEVWEDRLKMARHRSRAHSPRSE